MANTCASQNVKSKSKFSHWWIWFYTKKYIFVQLLSHGETERPIQGCTFSLCACVRILSRNLVWLAIRGFECIINEFRGILIESNKCATHYITCTLDLLHASRVPLCVHVRMTKSVQFQEIVFFCSLVRLSDVYEYDFWLQLMLIYVCKLFATVCILQIVTNSKCSLFYCDFPLCLRSRYVLIPSKFATKTAK